MNTFKQSKNGRGIPVTESNRPDEFTTTAPDETAYLRWKTPGSFNDNDVFTEDPTKKVVICRMKIVDGVGTNQAAYDLWSDRETANYVPWSQQKQIIK